MSTFPYVIFAFLLTVLVVSSEIDVDRWKTEWQEFKEKHGKTYLTKADEEHRRKIWRENFQFIKDHNKAFANRTQMFLTGLNDFSDMSNLEFKTIKNGFKRLPDTSKSNGISGEPIHTAVDLSSLPDKVDWRDHNLVTPVKNQGSCGSCWSFSATGALEGQQAKKNGNLVSLSEQNLIDCSSKLGNKGCSGGDMNAAFLYVALNRGIDTESSYSYTEKEGTCQYNSDDIGAANQYFINVESGNETALLQAVATIGPISIAIDASRPSYQHYKSGIYYDPFCSSENLDHGVLLVGYGTENDVPYWLVKNSWGATWGQGGYAKMVRNRNNNCGIATRASYPVVLRYVDNTRGSSDPSAGSGYHVTANVIYVVITLFIATLTR